MTTRLGDASPSKMGVWLGEDCTDIIFVSIKGETECGETTNASELEGPLGENHDSGISIVSGHKKLG
jgi:hypothetical protein